MKTHQFIIYSFIIISFTACSTMKKTEISNNPLFQKSTLQYQAPDFSKIKDEHYKPAFDRGLRVQTEEIENIVNNTEKPTFKNTVLALELSGQDLKRAQSIFYNLTSSNTNDYLQKLEEEYAPIFAAHSDKILLNEKLYNKIKQVYTENLDAESKRLVEVTIEEFELSGANLSASDKEKMKQINSELATLSSQFSSKLLEARKKGAILITDKNELNGLSDEEIASAAEDAKIAGFEGKYLLTLLNTTQQPLLQNLSNRATREKLFNASWLRAEQNNEGDTRATLEKMASLRLQKAKLMGKNSFAEWSLQDQMAKTPEAAFALLKKLADPAVIQAKKEAAEIQQLINQQGENFTVQPWDWNYYAEQLRKSKYDLDENQIKPYFEVMTVLEKGVFYAAEKFYGITFKERKDLPVYNPDVVAYEVFDRDGKSIAIYYLDFFTRDNKKGGAWMENFVQQSTELDQKPVIVNVFNYQKPAPGKPSLISYDDVSTMFHEFGHTLHGLFASQKYVTLSGTNVPRDFVEFPSQINEHFALEDDILKNYAIHYQTKESMPKDLIDKIKRASKFNQGYATTELVAAATLDMAWHTVTDENEIIPTLSFEKQALQKYGLLLNEVPPRYHSPYFAHIWGGGYSAGYYAYLWSETLDADAWEWIKSNGGITRANGDRFRQFILSVGNTTDLNQSYKDFSGRNPDIKPLLRNRGFIN